MHPSIRLAAADDLGAAGEVLVAAYRYGGFLDDSHQAYAATLADTPRRSREAELYVALVDGAVVGTVTFCPEGSSWREIGRPREGEFRMLGVSPAAAGAGVGSALVQRCLDRSGELGYERLVISSLPSMSSAHRLYERIGFQRAPERDWSPAQGVVLHAYLLDLADSGSRSGSAIA
jgi:ribosomal protein S18 acetylase RimI-like enzyme